jgi:cytoskeletal protein CcmA (bactofilin family)
MFKRKTLFETEAPQALFEKEEPKTQKSGRPGYSNNHHSSYGVKIEEPYSEPPSSSTELENNNELSPLKQTNLYNNPSWESQEESFTPPNQMSVEKPETTLGKGVHFKGTLSFKRLLRIDGTFEGELISDGKVIIGPTGVVKSNITMTEAIIEGYVEGNITAKDRLEIRGEAQVHGNIIAKVLSIDEGATIAGHVHVTPNKEDRQKTEEANEKEDV